MLQITWNLFIIINILYYAIQVADRYNDQTEKLKYKTWIQI